MRCSLLVLFLIMAVHMSAFADDVGIILTPGQNEITVSITNNYFSDLTNLTVQFNEDELPGWLSINDVIDVIDIPKGQMSSDKIKISMNVNDAPEITYTIPLKIVDDSGNSWEFSIPVTVNNNLPVETALFNNYPNPFNPTTSIGYSLNSSMHTRLDIYNTLGQKVRTLVDSMQSQGSHVIQWDGKNELGQNVSSGVYFYRLTADSFVQTKRMMFVE